MERSVHVFIEEAIDMMDIIFTGLTLVLAIVSLGFIVLCGKI